MEDIREHDNKAPLKQPAIELMSFKTQRGVVSTTVESVTSSERTINPTRYQGFASNVEIGNVPVDRGSDYTSNSPLRDHTLSHNSIASL